MRERVRAVVEARWFQATVISLILVNAVMLGAETSPRVMAAYGGLLHAADTVVLGVFVVELALRMYAHGGRFFRDPWSWFDLVIVIIALLPATGPFAVLRMLRVLRVLRLLSVIPTLRHVVSGLLRALPGMASIALLVALLLYVSAVMATKLFQHTAPEYFGDLMTSLFTLFQMMTGDSWGEIAKSVMVHHPMAWLFFVSYILASTFIALNLFIAVAVEALEHEDDDRNDDRRAAPEPGSGAEILGELRALRSEVAALRRDAGRG